MAIILFLFNTIYSVWLPKQEDPVAYEPFRTMNLTTEDSAGWTPWEQELDSSYVNHLGFTIYTYKRWFKKNSKIKSQNS
jgi:hypothetical protein